MVNNIELGNDNMYEWWYLTYPFEQYRAIMQAMVDNYIRMDEGNREENLDKAIYILERLKEKEVEHKGKQLREPIYNPFRGFFDSTEEEDKEISQHELFLEYRKDYLKKLYDYEYRYIARDLEGDLIAFKTKPLKCSFVWWKDGNCRFINEEHDLWVEVQWEDDEPTEIAELLAEYENRTNNKGEF